MAVRFTPNGGGIAEIHRRSDAFVERLADLSAEDMRRTAPVDTGDMVGTIRVEKPAEMVRHVKCGGQFAASGEYVDYAVYVELGTSRMAAQPFMRPALYRLRTAAEGLGF
ncbi:MAG TPA: HK97-gp10 family putative phage morphogenesis protein [Microbacterium sp.]|nr:HK97-gp10 family putative phage morphogenesis protein [Microbacterium sp.]